MSRFTIDLGEVADHQILDVAAKLGVATKAEVVRKALGFLNYVVEQNKVGFRLIIENSVRGTRTEIVVL